MTTLEQEFQDYANCFKYDLARENLVEYYMSTLLLFHPSTYPLDVQQRTRKFAEAKADDHIEQIKNTNIIQLRKIANNAWKRELEKLETSL